MQIQPCPLEKRKHSFHSFYTLPAGYLNSIRGKETGHQIGKTNAEQVGCPDI